MGDPVVLKQHKEYQKKNPIAMTAPQHKFFDGSFGNLTTDVSGGTKVGIQLDQLDSDKADGVEDIFADMPLLEDASNHDRSSPR